MSENNEKKIIDETNYQMPQKKQFGPAAIGKGGDPLFRRIRASKEELVELLEETSTIQDWIQRETCNNVALDCLNSENLKEAYFEIKDGFGEYGPIVLMGYKTPQGVNIPRLKILDKNGEAVEILSGPAAIEEIVKRSTAYKNLQNKSYETIDEYIVNDDSIISEEINEYKS